MKNRQTEREGEGAEYVDTESESEAWLVGQLVIDRGKGQNSNRTYLPYSSLLIFSLCMPRSPWDSEKGFTDCDSIWVLVTLLNRATLDDRGESCGRKRKNYD